MDGHLKNGYARECGHGVATQLRVVPNMMEENTMKTLARFLMFGACLFGSLAIAEEKPKMKMDTMAAKKQMMVPENMAAAKKAMMGEKSMLPGMVAKEMVHQEAAHDEATMKMIEESSMMADSDDKMMISDDHISMAGMKMMEEPTSMQMLFQELVARHIASKKMAAMM